jgi:molecular chaperone GrpE
MLFSKDKPESKKEEEKKQEPQPQKKAEEAKKPEPPKAPSAPAPAKPAEAKAAEEKKPSPEAVELASMKDSYIHLLADFDNYRKRQAREYEERSKRAAEGLLKELLPIVDHLELALAKAEKQDDPFVVGVKMVYDQFFATLKKNGMEPIEAKGQKFDPSVHEALSQMSSPTVPAQMVLDQYRRGWKLAGHVVRPAQVIVSSGKPAETAGQAAGDAASVTD